VPSVAGSEAAVLTVWGNTPMKLFTRLFRADDGATAIEYGLIAALIAVAAITAMQSLGSNLEATFNKVSTNMTAGA
jgi:pilus assembly protein Flp/PilA